MGTHTIFEHEKVSFKKLGIEHDHPLLSEIDQLNKQAGVDLVTIGRDFLKASQYVGILKIGKIVLQILPKIEYLEYVPEISQGTASSNDTAVRTAAINLLFLISYTHNLPVKAIDQAALVTSTSEWFELLTRIFATELHDLMSGGMSRSYILREENLPLLRGRWEIEKQLRRQPHIRHRFDVTYDEYSSDTPLNRVFRFVSQRLLHLTNDHLNQTLLCDLLEWFQNVEHLETIDAIQIDQITFTRLNDHFRPPFNLARLFLELGVMQFESGSTQAYAFVFDMNQLFERFLTRFIERHRQLILPKKWADIQILPQSHGYIRYLAERASNNKRVFQLKPDIIFSHFMKKPDLIIDTKYKQLDHGIRRLGVSESDFYQMVAYITRLNCEKILMLYPRRFGMMSVMESFHVIERDAVIHIADINLNWPIRDYRVLVQELRNIFEHIV